MRRLFQPGRRHEFLTMWAALCAAWAGFSALAIVLSCAHGGAAMDPLPALGFIAATAIGLLVFPPALLFAGHAVCRGARHLLHSLRTPQIGRSRHVPG